MKRCILLVIPLLSVLSCQKLDREILPLSLAAEEDEVYTWTKAVALKDAGHSTMRIWTEKITSSGSSTVMNGYRADWSDSMGWYYENVLQGQSLQYWALDASEFRFHAAAPYSAVSAIDANGVKLSLAAPTQKNNETALFSMPKSVASGTSDFGQTVSLKFRQAYARLEFKFCLAQQQTGTENKTIKNIYIQPANPKTFPKAAVLTATHNWSDLSTSTVLAVSSVSAESQKITVGGGSVAFSVAQTGPTAENGGKKYKSVNPQYLYMIPDSNASAKWTLSLQIDGVTRNVTLDAGQCKWEMGKSYRYLIDVYNDFIIVKPVSVEAWTPQTINVEVEGE